MKPVLTSDDVMECTCLVNKAAPYLRRTPDEAWMQQLDEHTDLLLAAPRYLSGLEAAEFAVALWPWCLERGHYDVSIDMLLGSAATFGSDFPFSLRINACIGLGVLWQRSQNFSEAEQYLNLAWNMTQVVVEPFDKGLICHYQGLLFRRTARYEDAENFHNESLAYWKTCNDLWGIATANDALGIIAFHHNKLGSAYNFFSTANEFFLKTNDTKQRARVLNNIGMVLGQRDEHALALQAYRQGSELFRKIGDLDGLGKSLYNQGDLYFEMRQHAKAGKLLMESLEVARRLEYTAYTAFAIYNLAFIAQRQRQETKAAILLGMVETLCQDKPVTLSQDMQRNLAECREGLRTSLHANTRAALNKRGRKMSLSDVWAYLNN